MDFEQSKKDEYLMKTPYHLGRKASLRIFSALAIATGLLAGSFAVTASAAISNPSVVRTVPTGNQPETLWSDGTYVWATSNGSGNVTEINELTGAVVHTILFPGISTSGIASNGTDIWVTNFQGNVINEMSMALITAYPSVSVPSASVIVKTLTTASEPSDISFSGGYFWVTTQSGQTLLQIDPALGTVIKTYTTSTGDLNYPRGVSADATNVWVADPGYTFGGNNNSCATTGTTQWNNTVSKINIVTGIATSVAVGNAYVAGTTSGSQPWDVSADGTNTWVTLKCQSAVAYINDVTNTVGLVNLPAGSLPEGVVSDGTDVWVSESGLNQVQEIQISTDTIVHTVPLAAASNPWGIVSDGAHVWVAASGNNNVAEIADTPHLTPSTLPDGTVGVPYSQALTISGGTAPYTVTCNGTPPAGLTVTPSGTGVLITGTPTTAGPDANAVNCTVTDANTATSTSVIPITIDAAVVVPTTPALTPTSLPDGTVGSAYSQTLTVTGGTAPYVITCALSTPPAGLTVSVTPSSPATIPPSDTGVLISGTPTTTGTDSNAVNCTVTDTNGRTSSSIIPITVDAAVVVTPTPPPATPAVVVPPTLTVGPASGVTTTSATLNGTVNPNGTAITSEDFCYIEGSTLTDCAGATTVAIVPATLPASTSVTSLAATAATLYANSPYCYQLEATNGYGTYYSTPVCFSTSASATAATVTPAVILPGGLRFITHFGENLYSLTASDKVTIHALAVFIKTHADTSDALIGYTDPLNTKSYNLALGERRANAVATQLEKDLVAMGDNDVSTATTSGGATNYVVVGLSNSARAKDRRVTISVS